MLTTRLYPLLPLLNILLITACGQALQNLDGLPAVIIASDEQIANKDVLPNHYIAMFKSHAGINRTDFANYHEETGFYAGFLADQYNYDYEVKDIRLITALTLPEANYTTPYSLQWQQNTSSNAVGLITEITFASNHAAQQYLHEWHAKGMLYFAEPVYVSYPNLSDTFKQEHKKYADADNWWHKEINLIDALNLIAANNSADADCEQNCRFNSLSEITNPPIIAVLDSGIDYGHPSLKEQMFRHRHPSADYGCGNDKHGCNTAELEHKGVLGNGKAHPWGTDGPNKKCPRTHRNCAHGTHVAGIIAADLGEQGTLPALGVCPFCKILNIRVMSDAGTEACNDEHGNQAICHKGSVTDSALLNALKYIEELVSRGENIRVINASIGKFHRSRSVSLLAANLRQPAGEAKLGVIAVAAAGNEDTMVRNYPAALDSFISVAATNSEGKKSYFSNYGVWIDIAAPGGGSNEKIRSTVPGGSFHPDLGTSMAAPVVAGAIGLAYAVDRPQARKDIVNSTEMLLRLKSFSSEMKLYCIHTKSDKYGVLPNLKLNITLQEYQAAKAKEFTEHCPRIDLASQSSLKEALRNSRYYIEFANHPEKIPLIGLGMLDIEAMLRREGTQLNPLINHTFKSQRVHCVYCCGSLQDRGDSANKHALLLLLFSIAPIALVFRFKS